MFRKAQCRCGEAHKSAAGVLRERRCHHLRISQSSQAPRPTLLRSCPAVHLSWEREVRAFMFVPRPIGFVSSPYNNTTEIPKGLHTKHEAEGILSVLPEFEIGLTDIEG